MSTPAPHATRKGGSWIPLACAVGVAGMVGMAYAAVPLYRVFCQVTGYGGTTQAAEKASDTVLDRKVTIRFDANVNRDIAWNFRPVQNQVTIKVGETGLAFFEASNPTSKTLTGTATFNVTPPQAGPYFNKIDCFCFTEQTLAPGARADMPVSFFVDPAIAEDHGLDSISTITLSYTFFPARPDRGDVAAAGNAPARVN